MKKNEAVFNNGFFEFLETEEEVIINGEPKLVKRNIVRRPPGIRAIIINHDKRILLSKEYRLDLQKWDYRLPGGKVFENLYDYKKSLIEGTILANVEKTVVKEVKEEVGIVVKNQSLIKITKAGSGITWDLYYYEITDFEVKENGQQLEENEFIDGFVWKTFEEIKEMCINQDINEDRSIGVLLTYILENNN